MPMFVIVTNSNLNVSMLNIYSQLKCKRNMYVRIDMFVSIKRTEQNSKIQLKRIFKMKLELGLNTKLFPSCHKKVGK